MIQLIHGDCLEEMKKIPDGSIDMVLTDPPYGTTACKWDTVIDLELMWEQLERVIKPNGAIVMTAGQPFTSKLVSSNYEMYKHCWVWDKKTITNPLQAKYQPLRQHEDVLVFSEGTVIYNPQKTDLDSSRAWKQGGKQDTTGGVVHGTQGMVKGKYPKTIQQFKPAKFEGKNVHPTQKPVALMEYLIKTYTNENETVLDFTMGSGTTGVACKNLNRNFIGIELDEEYFKIAKGRIHI